MKAGLSVRKQGWIEAAAMGRVLSLFLLFSGPAAAVLLVAPRAAFCQSDSRPRTFRLPGASAADERRFRIAIDRGLRFLQSSSAESGRIGSKYPVGTTSLAGLAVLGAGFQPGQEPFDEMLKRCVGYLLESATPSGYITESDSGSDTDSGSRMHGHCFAILFLTQVLGSLPLEMESDVRNAIERGVHVIEGAQSREGGWYYTPRNESQRDEASVTICAVQALRAARNSGFRVNRTTIDQGISYVRRCQEADGSVRYSLSGRDRRTSFSLTAAAVATLNAAGVYKGTPANENSVALRRGTDYLKKFLALEGRRPERAVKPQFFFYGNLYTAQALFQEGGATWKKWYPTIRQNLLKADYFKQSDKPVKGVGWWVTPAGESPYGREYATAVTLLILEIPLGYLPIFQR